MAGDPFELQRFVDAQAPDYDRALAELRNGRKATHWMWYVLPQLRGLSASVMATRYGIGSLDEARAFLAHPILGPRLIACVKAMNALPGTNAEHVLGSIDAAKFRSCVTLFGAVQPEEPLFAQALRKYFMGAPDHKTLALLEAALG